MNDKITREDLGIPSSSLALVSKITQRVMVFHLSSLDFADCYQAVNVRDFNSWNLVQANVPEQQANDWLHGNDLALDSVR